MSMNEATEKILRDIAETLDIPFEELIADPPRKETRMTEREKAVIMEMLDKSDVRVSMMRQPIEIGPDKRGNQQYELSKTMYVLVCVGPPDVSKENTIRAILGHDPMGFGR